MFDTETTADMTQRLMIGCWRLCRTDETNPDRPQLECLEEGLFYPDDLEHWNPDGAHVIEQLRSEHAWALDAVDDPIADPRLKVVGQKEFLRCRHLQWPRGRRGKASQCRNR